MPQDAQPVNKRALAWRIWAARHPERRRAQKRRWYAKHAEQIKARERRRYQENVAKNKDYYKDPEKVRERMLKHRRGITTDDYRALAAQQNHQCAICGIPEAECPNGVLHIDHDHVTKKIRGLLCGLCNRMLGHAHDDPKRLVAAANYLMENS
jgi:ferredoxin